LKARRASTGNLTVSSILTAAYIVHRISADRAPISEPGAFGIRPEPAAAIVRRRGGQTRRAPADAAVGRRKRRGCCERG
jgi:hypothetical protein